jgi:hypothetical protein
MSFDRMPAARARLVINWPLLREALGLPPGTEPVSIASRRGVIFLDADQTLYLSVAGIGSPPTAGEKMPAGHAHWIDACAHKRRLRSIVWTVNGAEVRT